SEGSGSDDFSELKKITTLLAKAFNRKKFYSKPTNNNLRTSSTSQSANKKQEFVKTDNKRVEKKDDEKKRDMSRVKCYNRKEILQKIARKSKSRIMSITRQRCCLQRKIKMNKFFWLKIKHGWNQASSSSADEKISEQTSSLKPYVPNVILEKIIIDLEGEVVNLLEKEKVNLVTTESLKSKGFESSENVSFESKNQNENDCLVVENECDKEENSKIVQICLWIIDSGCSKHMTGNRALLTNFVEKFLRTVRFGNNDFAVIAGYGDVVIGSITIKKVYY
nr:integrase, catalytic region, zinc finger, CCHC-type, peptidase aspartic, catalytic [Tanacetum cinerariifolium]